MMEVDRTSPETTGYHTHQVTYDQNQWYHLQQQQQQQQYNHTMLHRQTTANVPFTVVPTTTTTTTTQIVQVQVPGTQQSVLVCSATGTIVGVQPIAFQQHQQQQTSSQFVPIVGGPVIHNLIPEHLQASALAPSLNGTPGYQPAVISPQQFAVAAAAVTAIVNLQQQYQQQYHIIN